MTKYCLVCKKRAYSDYCVSHKPRKRIKQKGKRTIEYEEWRDFVAIPYLTEKFGYKCVDCGVETKLDVAHIKTRGGHAALKMKLDNVCLKCRDCHNAESGIFW